MAISRATLRAESAGGTRAGKPRRGAPWSAANDPAWVGVRELRQNLSVYLDRVKEGETLTVTEHGVVVAVLAPAPAATLSPIERLVAEGRATAPTGSLRDRQRPKPLPPGSPSSEEILAELREDRFP
jgi:prevent-host-death family protein